ncbi:hypothetical protein WJX84_003938 [Apatococcus fuscideae]|uniref:Major facilitator superfamily (MFS) profile domain-containing protein n=1 Tax=Apatococcus fuscideae TaxID=2026836 RepID=A0AAW1TG97_9CHLO
MPTRIVFALSGVSPGAAAMDTSTEAPTTSPSQTSGQNIHLEPPQGFAAVFSHMLRAGQWISSWAVPGLGMFCEAYYIFSVGNVKPVWAAQWPDCFQKNASCTMAFINSLEYSQVAGLIVGMILLGVIVDRTGRRLGSIFTACFMATGGILLTVSTGSSPHATVLMIIIVQAIFGFGVGGEFPVAASSASERAEHSKLHRGKTVQLVFSMQGWGVIFNLAVLMFFLSVLGTSHAPYDQSALSITWRLMYGLGLIPIAIMLFHRIFFLRESSLWQKRAADAAPMETAKVQQRSPELTKLALLLRFYWHRLLGTSLGWAAWDFWYYGNKLFQTEFIQILQPEAGLMALLEYNMLNSAVALIGYYVAAFTIDLRWVGRRRMQVNGFVWIFALFLISGLAYTRLTASPSNLRWLQALYYLSSFWGQAGPNATTFVLASELFPTDVRGMGCGISAAVGKFGALAANIVLGKISSRAKFYYTATAAGVGALVTLIFIPEITGLDLREGDKRWHAIQCGEPEAYCGQAIDARYLSWCENLLVSFGRSQATDAKSILQENQLQSQLEDPNELGVIQLQKGIAPFEGC